MVLLFGTRIKVETLKPLKKYKDKQQGLLKMIINQDATCVMSMLEDLKLPILQQRRLETRLVMLYKVVRGMVPAINADRFLIPIRNKRNIKPRLQSDFQTTNIVENFSTNHSECFKIPDSHTEQYRNSLFVRTVSE